MAGTITISRRSTTTDAAKPLFVYGRTVPEERAIVTMENVAILFTDIVGSTELSRRLAAEEADDVRRSHFSILRRAIAEAGGTEVKNLGDGLMVVFSSASAALACAVTMQQGVEQSNRVSPEAVGLRVGLSVGEAANEDGDYFGDPVVEAARLCARCDGGQILATDFVRAMAGRRNRHECRSLGELTLKGMPDTVETVEVRWEPLRGPMDAGAIPLPSRLAVRPDVGVLGRVGEIASIAQAFKRVLSGGRHEVVLVSGEPGLGKTTLVAEASRAAYDAGAIVLFGHSEEDLATPYQLFAEAFGRYVTHAPEELLLAHVAAHGSELGRLVPALGSRIRDLPTSRATDADTERFLLFAAAVGLLASVSERQPVVLVLDDLQWADKGSLLMLRHLAASDVPMQLLILGTYRDREISGGALPEVLAALHRVGGVARIELTGLDDAGVIALMEAAAGHELDKDAVGLAHAISRETDGNPFFVSEVLRNLVETGSIAQNMEGRWEANPTLDVTALPDSVREVIGARLLRLGKEAGRILSVAAVIGRDFDLDLLARATNSAEDEVLEVLDAATAVSLVRELADAPGRFSFAHALIQHTLYENLSLTRRARAHRNVAEALEILGGSQPSARVGELARHWTNAGQPKDLDKAIRYSRLAGEAALDGLAPADAVVNLTQALGLYLELADPDPAMGIDLAIGLGTAQRQTGDPSYRETLLDAGRRAADLGLGERVVKAALANDRGTFSTLTDIDTEKVDVLETALALLPDDHHARALVLANLCQELTFASSLERRRALADEAVALAEATANDAIIVRVLCQICNPLRVPHLLAQDLAWTADALARAERIGDPVLLFWAASRRNSVAGCVGNVEEMDRCLAITESLADQLNQPMLVWMHTLQCAARALIDGVIDHAERLANRAYELGTDSGQPDAFRMFGSQFHAVSFQRGTIGAIIPILEDSAAVNPDDPSAALVVAYAEVGRTDDARRLLTKLVSQEFEVPLDLLWTTNMAWFAEAAIECGDQNSAVSIFERLSPWADQFCSSGVTSFGPISHYLGGLAGVLRLYDDADSYFAHSAAMSDRMGARFFAARTDLVWGRMLAERKAPGDTKLARMRLRGAHATATLYGYGTVERRAAEVLRRLEDRSSKV